MDLVRTCYRSKWRLHEDPTILTPGRYYRAADDAPAVPFATYLGSREWAPDNLNQAFGEWGGAQEYDPGVPPRVLPITSVIGGDCFSKLLPAPSDGVTGRQFGRCVTLTTRSICGNIPLFTNFSIADPFTITYYENVPTYIAKDKIEGEWLGKVPDFDAIARVSVTEITPTLLDWRFALSGHAAGVPVDTPCAVCPPYPPGPTPPLNISVVLGGVPFSFTLTYLGGSPLQWGGGLDLAPGVFVTATLYCYSVGQPYRLGVAIFGTDDASEHFTTLPDGRPTFLSCTPWLAQFEGFNTDVDFGTPPATDIFGVPLGAAGTIPFTATVTPP